jgi:hypothetical protein
MTYHPPKTRPRPSDYHDESPAVWDWVAQAYTPPRTDGRKLETIAASIAKQFRDKARKPGKRRDD